MWMTPSPPTHQLNQWVRKALGSLPTFPPTFWMRVGEPRYPRECLHPLAFFAAGATLPGPYPPIPEKGHRPSSVCTTLLIRSRQPGTQALTRLELSSLRVPSAAGGYQPTRFSMSGNWTMRRNTIQYQGGCRFPIRISQSTGGISL